MCIRDRDKNTWEQWYGMNHEQPELIEQSVYGLVDIYADHIKKADLVAVPGCYPLQVYWAFLLY